MATIGGAFDAPNLLSTTEKKITLTEEEDRNESVFTYNWEEPAVSCRWTGRVREITGWSSRLEEIYRSF